eukprot:GHVL01016793.1.p1 GENE.GHVL01016793.1~~GHVL01016793.1.p1  ORF type:complete len:136 (+),score=9.43 GHVL01016793.1:659-1066(+)
MNENKYSQERILYTKPLQNKLFNEPLMTEWITDQFQRHNLQTNVLCAGCVACISAIGCHCHCDTDKAAQGKEPIFAKVDPNSFTSLAAAFLGGGIKDLQSACTFLKKGRAGLLCVRAVVLLHAAKYEWHGMQLTP